MHDAATAGECRPLPPTPLRAQVSAVDDVAYLREVINDLARRNEVDADRVYAWGHSLGGFMAHRLACDLADHIAAVVSVAGALSRNPCTPSRPVSILVYQADDDLDTPTQGNELFAPVADTVAAWRATNRCDPPQTLPTTPEYRTERATCEAGTAVEYVLLDEGGHDWVHAPDPVFDWFPHTWQFLQDHPISSTATPLGRSSVLDTSIPRRRRRPITRQRHICRSHPFTRDTVRRADRERSSTQASQKCRCPSPCPAVFEGLHGS